MILIEAFVIDMMQVLLVVLCVLCLSGVFVFVVPRIIKLIREEENGYNERGRNLGTSADRATTCAIDNGIRSIEGEQG